MSRTVVITGGSGFLGLHLVRRFLRNGDRVRVCDVEPFDDAELKSKIEFSIADVREAAAMDRLVDGADVVIHNAATLPIARAGKNYWSVNVDGTRNVLTAAKKHGVKKVISISTSAVYGIPKECPLTEDVPLTPLGKYAWSKFDAEHVCHEFREQGLDVSVLRPRTLVGSGRLGIFGILFDWIQRGKHIYIIGRGDNLFQLLSADDCVEGALLMTLKPCRNEDFDLGAAEFATVRDDLESLCRHAGTGSHVRSIPAWIAKPVLRTLDRLRLSPLVDWHYETPDKPFYFDTGKARRLLGWVARDTNVAMLAQTYDWYLKNKDQLDQRVGVTHRKTVAQKLLKLLRNIS